MRTTGTPERRRRLTLGAVLAVALVAVAALALTRDGGAREREELVAQWTRSLASWEAEQLAAIGPGGTALPATSLASAVDGLASRPVTGGGTAPTESLDDVNAACTGLTALAETIDATPQPPAAPQGLDTTHDDAAPAVARFDADRAALGTYAGAVGSTHAEVRRFCGTYALLVAARTGSATPSEANARIADALAVQCHLAELEPVCAADAEQARALAAAQTAGAAAGDVEVLVADGEAAFQEAAAAVAPGADRATVAALTVERVAAWETGLDAAAAAFAEALPAAR